MAVDFFLKFDSKITGEAVDTGFPGAIKLQSWTWGASQTSSVSGTGGSGAGKASFSDVSVMYDFDKSTPELLSGLAAGTHFAKATLSAVKAGAKGKPYLTLDLNEVFVTSLQMSGSSEIPSVSASFTFKNFNLDYKLQDKDGNLQTGATSAWDITKNNEN